jgi:Protein of unknown function (DUF1353)
VDSTPFAADPPPLQPMRIVLRQVSDDEFALQERLVVTWPPPPEGTTLVVEPEWLGQTDLASIPLWLGWFAHRAGGHTAVSLVHDLLVGNDESPTPRAELPPEWRLTPEQADLRFRDLLQASGVPPVRSYLMWAAVVARSRWRVPVQRLGLVLWGIAAALGSALFVVGLLAGMGWAVGLGLLGPLAAALLWGKQFWAGVIAGYSLWWVLFGSVPGWLAFKGYELVEWAVAVIRPGRPPAWPQPVEPVTFDKR